MSYSGRIRDIIPVPASTAGTLQAVFDPPPRGMVAVVSLIVPNAENTAVWGAFLGPGGQAASIGTWGGSGPFSTVLQLAGETVTVTGGQLVSGKNYQITRYGYATSDDETALLQRAAGVVPPTGPNPITTPPAPTGGGTSSGGSTGPPAQTGTGILVPSNLGVSVDNSGSSQIINVSGLQSYTLSNPDTSGISVWISRVPLGSVGTQAQVGHGIELVSPSFLYDSDWKGAVFGISAGAAVTLGVSYIVAV